MINKYHIILAVSAFIYFPKKGILIIKKSKTQKVDGGLWTVPGGKVNKDEPIIDALKREVKEEVGLILVDYKWIGEDVFTNGEDFYHAQHFICHIKKSVKVILEKGSFLGYEWVKDKKDIDKHQFHPNVKNEIINVFKLIGVGF